MSGNSESSIEMGEVECIELDISKVTATIGHCYVGFITDFYEDYFLPLAGDLQPYASLHISNLTIYGLRHILSCKTFRIDNVFRRKCISSISFLNSGSSD